LVGIIFSTAFSVALLNAAEPAVPILVYHSFGAGRGDSMTVATEHFRQQLDLLCKNHFSVIPLADLVAWPLGSGPASPPRSFRTLPTP
jgi:hypothetical protein